MSSSATQQRDHKLHHVRRELARPDLPIRWVPGRALAYRRRIRMRVDASGRAMFFNPDKNGGCVVLAPSLVNAVNAVACSSFVGASHLEVRAVDRDGRAGLLVVPHPGQALDEQHLRRLLPGFVVGTPPAARARQRFTIHRDVWCYVPLDAFLQVHDDTNRQLVDAVVAGALARGALTFFDPFAGAGNHSLALAAATLVGTAADIHAGAITAVSDAAAEQHLALATRIGAAEHTLHAARAVDLLLLNPPRAGLRHAAPALAAAGAPHVAFIHCTARGLARDLHVFEAAGYHLTELTAFDMFPHTEHVELLSWLARAPSANTSANR